LQFVGTRLSTAVDGALVTSASPAFIVLFAALILRERLTWRGLAAMALATLGVVVIIDPAQASFGGDVFAGNVALAFAAVMWGLYSVLVRRVSARHDTLTVTLYALLGGLLLTAPAALFESRAWLVGPITPGMVVEVLYLGIICTSAAMWLWNRAFALVEASTAALFFFAQPVVGALLGVWLLGQRMTPGLWAGGLLIGAGLLLALRRGATPPVPSQPDDDR
jgi:drug/metabolite transporter (DMT)-like permease